MPKPGRTQKQIAERYKGNLGYYRRLHPLRRTRLIVSLLTIFGGLLAIFLFPRWGHQTFFNAGKIATAHAKFADNCEKCHDPSATSGKFSKVLRDRFRNVVTVEAIKRKCRPCHQQNRLLQSTSIEDLTVL